MARRPRGPQPSANASAPAPPAASSGTNDDAKKPKAAPMMVSSAVHEQFKSYLAAAANASASQSNTSSSTGWDSPKSSPSTKASSLASTAGNKGKGKQVAKAPEKPKALGAEQWLALPAGVRLADAFESPKGLCATAPKVEPQVSKPIAPAFSKKSAVVASLQPAGAPEVPAPVSSLGPAPVVVPLIPSVPALVAEPVAPQKQVPFQYSGPKASKVSSGTVVDDARFLHGVLPVEMEGVVYHKNPKFEFRDFDGDVVMQDLLEVPMQVPKKLDAVLGQRKFKRQRQKSKVSSRVIQMAEDEIKRMRRSL
ncbi:hypothetical protein TWF281_001533 [Arthrobotrys megalospora]